MLKPQPASIVHCIWQMPHRSLACTLVRAALAASTVASRFIVLHNRAGVAC